MRPPSPESSEVLEQSRQLVKTLYRVFREDDRLSRDNQLCIALQKPSLGLVATLANASASGQITWFEKGVRYSRSYAAEIRVLLDLAQDVNAIDDRHHRELQAIVVSLQTMLDSLSTALQRRVAGG